MNFNCEGMKYLLNSWKCALLLLFVLTGCSTKEVASFHSFDTECLGVELDGSETVRAWGKGKNRADALEQAKKNAVRDVLFKGITAGSRECSVRPLLTEVNAQERYAYYFNNFFRDGGEYLNYVSMEDKKSNSNTKSSNKTQVSYSTTVRVLRLQLQQKLIEDKILKP